MAGAEFIQVIHEQITCGDSSAKWWKRVNFSQRTVPHTTMPKPGYIHRRSGSVNWSSHTTIASESNLAQPYTSRASCSIALPKMLCWRDDWHSFIASAACAEASRVRNVDVIAMWRAARDRSVHCGISAVVWENFPRKVERGKTY